MKFSDFAHINPQIKLLANEMYPFTEMKDLEDGQRFAYPSIERTLTGGARFEEGDTLFARITPCLENGKICQAGGLKGGKGFGSTEFLVFRARPGISDPDFVYYLSRWDEVRRYAELHLVGTSGRQRVPKDVFDKLELALPDLPSQTRIASILSALDDKIELNRCTNHTLEQMAQTLFKKYFVDDIDLNSSVECSLLDFAKLLSGGTPKTDNPAFWDGGIKWVSAKDVTPNDGRFILNTEKTISKLGLENSSAKLLPQYSTIITARGTVGKICLLSEEMAISQSNYGLKAINDSYDFVLFQLVNFSLNDLKSRSYGTVFDTITTQTLRELRIILPEHRQIQELSHKLIHPYMLILSNLSENLYLASIRDTILPKLMSGEIEIP
jgi:type I restriction enzyme S subunit